jgi:hypothetical protein
LAHRLDPLSKGRRNDFGYTFQPYRELLKNVKSGGC